VDFGIGLSGGPSFAYLGASLRDDFFSGKPRAVGDERLMTETVAPIVGVRIEI
jgi:hypothetical protein